MGLAYAPKSDELMSEMGLGEFVTDIGRCATPWLIRQFECERSDADRIQRRVREVSLRYQAALAEQYDAVLGRAPREGGGSPGTTPRTIKPSRREASS